MSITFISSCCELTTEAYSVTRILSLLDGISLIAKLFELLFLNTGFDGLEFLFEGPDLRFMGPLDSSIPANYGML